jgi:hypothetical protein
MCKLVDYARHRIGVHVMARLPEHVTAFRHVRLLELCTSAKLPTTTHVPINSLPCLRKLVIHISDARCFDVRRDT